MIQVKKSYVVELQEDQARQLYNLLQSAKSQDQFTYGSLYSDLRILYEAGKKSAQKLHSERWMCLETGHTTNAGALTRFQKHRGIDTSKRKRVA